MIEPTLYERLADFIAEVGPRLTAEELSVAESIAEELDELEERADHLQYEVDNGSP